MFKILFGKVVHQSWLIVAMCVGIIIGVVVGLVFRVDYFMSGWWTVLVILTMVVGYLKPKGVFVVLALLAGMVLALCRVAEELAGDEYVRSLYDAEVVVTGTVCGDPEEDEGEIKMKLTDLRFGEEEVAVKGNLYVKINGGVDVQREDLVRLEGKMLNGFGTYAGFLYKPRVVKVLRPEPGSWVLMLRNWFAERVKELIPEEEAGLGLSYLLGMKTGLSKELSENLRVVGLTHIVVASGAHLSILVEVARKLFGKLSRFAGLLFSVVFVVIFMAMVGWTPSIMRAGVMAILTLVTWYVGRKIFAWRLILMVMAFTLMLEPEFVINLGWLLSFASYMGIMMLGPYMCKFFYGERKPGFVGSTVMMTVSATVMTLPIILYYYGAVSLIAVVANLLILPTLSVAMGLVFMTGALASMPGVSVVVAWCAKMLLYFHIAVVSWFGGMRELLVEMPVGQVWVFLLYLLVVVPMAVGLIWRKVVKLR